MLKLPHTIATNRINECIRKLPRNCTSENTKYKTWNITTQSTIESIFEDASKVSKFQQIIFAYPITSAYEHDQYLDSEKLRAYKSGYEQARAYLKSLITLITDDKKYGQDNTPITLFGGTSNIASNNHTKKAAPTTTPATKPTKVFIVHGHDDGLKNTVARSVDNMLGKGSAVILHEQPNNGKTVIEKFEHNSDVGYAIALFTGDDLGKAKNGSDLQPRTRQNVVFELGFFVGKLGRDKVCVLHKDDVEILSDYQGVVYISATSDAWNFKLATELKAAGYEIDMNDVV